MTTEETLRKLLDEHTIKEIERMSQKEAKAVYKAIEALQEAFDVNNFQLGWQGDDFLQQRITLRIKLGKQ